MYPLSTLNSYLVKCLNAVFALNNRILIFHFDVIAGKIEREIPVILASVLSRRPKPTANSDGNRGIKIMVSILAGVIISVSTCGPP